MAPDFSGSDASAQGFGSRSNSGLRDRTLPDMDACSKGSAKRGRRQTMSQLMKRKRRKIEVGVKFYDRWEEIGSLEGLKTDTQIVKFLIQQYENVREATACCVRCSTPLTLYCTKCLLPAAETQAAQKKSNLQNSSAGRTEQELNSASLTTPPIKSEPDGVVPELRMDTEPVKESISHKKDQQRLVKTFRLEDPFDHSDDEEVVSGDAVPQAKPTEENGLSITGTVKQEADSLEVSAVSEIDGFSDTPSVSGNADVDVKQTDPEFTTPVALRSDQPLGLPYKKKYKRGEKPSRCSICEVVFPNRQLMKQHRVAEHSVERPYQCHLCSAAFKVKKHRKDHMLSHTGEKPFLCTVCGMGFSFHCGLKTHMRTHTKERPFVCKTCGAAFMQSCNLKVHLRTHTGERPFVCNVCGFAFTTSSHLIRHMYTHADERQYVCKECGRAFKTPACLKAHERTHKGEKPAQCPVCGARFANTAYIKVHMRSHTGERPYVCDICNASFKESGKLTKHKRANHR